MKRKVFNCWCGRKETDRFPQRQVLENVSPLTAFAAAGKETMEEGSRKIVSIPRLSEGGMVRCINTLSRNIYRKGKKG